MPEHTRTCRHIVEITIDGEMTRYVVRRLDPDPRVAFPAFRMTKLSAEGDSLTDYDIHQDQFGAACTCPDGTYRAHKEGRPCKHVASLQAIGLMPKE